MSELAVDLVRRRVSLIVAGGSALPARAAQEASTSTTIPIVFTVGDDPVKAGIVQSLNRPGRNATGAMILTSETGTKRLALLHELVLAVRSIGVLIDPSIVTIQNDELTTAAALLAVSLHSIPVTQEEELDSAFAEFVRWGVGGVLVHTSARFSGA